VPFQPVSPLPLRQQFPGASDDALELLGRMVALDPNRRPSGDGMWQTNLWVDTEHGGGGPRFAFSAS
jgi:hypothetical protein